MKFGKRLCKISDFFPKTTDRTNVADDQNDPPWPSFGVPGSETAILKYLAL